MSAKSKSGIPAGRAHEAITINENDDANGNDESYNKNLRKILKIQVMPHTGKKHVR